MQDQPVDSGWFAPGGQLSIATLPSPRGDGLWLADDDGSHRGIVLSTRCDVWRWAEAAHPE